MGPADQIAIADEKLLDGFHTALKTAGKTYDIKMASAIICKFMDIATGLKTEGEWVSIVDIFGARVPKEVAKILRAVVKKFVDDGDVTEKNKWQVLEYLAADHRGK